MSIGGKARLRTPSADHARHAAILFEDRVPAALVVVHVEDGQSIQKALVEFDHMPHLGTDPQKGGVIQVTEQFEGLLEPRGIDANEGVLPLAKVLVAHGHAANMTAPSTNIPE